ncbi:hypothetical protein PSTEL_08410 [Paenibacillus stellifer]|uniref:HTH lacI-type domain-containing protein n=1 Tax=Paenibacillus stellifer TaxID=169760 RepID=A0A089LV34_9BACL|nr:hypothetical protein PSTEL_08410 [Paenibacillus stellifer]
MRCIHLAGKVTIQQIADMAGVSKFAVSRALSGKSGVSEKTRAHIVRTAGNLGFFNTNRVSPPSVQVPQTAGITGTVVILFPNIRYQNVENKFWGVVFEGISKRLEHSGLNIVTLTQPSGESITRILNPETLLGVIGVGTVSTQSLLQIRDLNVPLVLIDHIDPAVVCDGIFADNFDMMRKLMLKLISRDYQKFQFVGDPSYAYSFGERWRAFETVLEEYRIPHQQMETLLKSGKSEYDLIMDIPREELPEVFICANDSIAVEVSKALRERGIAIPWECAVTGFDDTPLSEDNVPPLTSVHVPREAMGAKAVDRLLERIRNKEDYFEKIMLIGDIILRASTR